MIVKLTLEDALVVTKDMRAEDRFAARALTGSGSAEWIAANRWQSEGPAWCLYQDQEPVAIFGISMHSPWCGTAWLICRPSIDGQSWRKLIRHWRTVAANLKGSPMRRVEALVLEDWAGASRFAECFGMKLEGTKRGAGQAGENLQIWGFVA